MGFSIATDRWYAGERCSGGCRVVVLEGAEVRPLRTRTNDPLWSFSWGRSGSSARELAWSVLYDSAHDMGLADDWCSAFTAEVISLLPRHAFWMASRDVLAWLYDGRPGRATDRLLRHTLQQSTNLSDAAQSRMPDSVRSSGILSHA